MKKIIIFVSFLALIGFFAFVYFYSIIAIKDYRAAKAENVGDEYIQKVYSEYTITGKNCQGEDTDQNGYVSCGFRIKNVENLEKTVRLECPTIFKSFTGSSCKESLSLQESFN
jgi:hypothetical protein